MGDLTAIAQKLAELRAQDEVYENGARVISHGGVPSGLSALMRVIDDTVLERKLEIMTGSHIISLVAAGRRLRGISAVVPPKGKSPRLVGEPLSREDKRTLEGVRELLTDLLTAAPRLTLRSLPADPFGKSGERGISASGLIDLWDIDMDEDPLPPMERFLRANANALEAYLHVSGADIVASDGDVATLQGIWQEQVDAFLKTQERLPGHASGAQLVSLDGAFENGKAVALGLLDEEMILLVFDPAALGPLHMSWQAIVA